MTGFFIPVVSDVFVNGWPVTLRSQLADRAEMTRQAVAQIAQPATPDPAFKERRDATRDPALRAPRPKKEMTVDEDDRRRRLSIAELLQQLRPMDPQGQGMTTFLIIIHFYTGFIDRFPMPSMERCDLVAIAENDRAKPKLSLRSKDQDYRDGVIITDPYAYVRTSVSYCTRIGYPRPWEGFKERIDP